MTRILEAAEFQCNRCKKMMRFRDPKTIMADALDGQNLERLDVHLCPDCKGPVLDFINTSPPRVPKTMSFARGRGKRN